MKYIYIILLLTISCNAQKVCRRDIIVVPPDTTVPPPIVYPNLMVVISDYDTSGHGLTIKNTFIDEYGDSATIGMYLGNFNGGLAYARNCGAKVYIRSYTGIAANEDTAQVYYDRDSILSFMTLGSNLYEELTALDTLGIIVASGAGTDSNMTGYGNGLEFWDEDDTQDGLYFSSYSNARVAAKLLKIKQTLNCTWEEARSRARLTASNPTWDKYNGYGKINVDSAIAWTEEEPPADTTTTNSYFPVIAQTADGTNYYYASSDNGGNDANNGLTPSTPKATLPFKNATFMNALEPGDSVLLKRGSEWESYNDFAGTVNGTPSGRIVFGAYGTKGTEITTGVYDNDPYIHASRMDMNGQCWDLVNIRFDDFTLRASGWSAGSSSPYPPYDNGIEVTATAYFARLNITDYFNHDVKIQNCTFYENISIQNRTHPSHIPLDNLTSELKGLGNISKLEIAGCYFPDTQTWGEDRIAAGLVGDSLWIHNNTMFGALDNCIDIGSGSNHIVECNLIARALQSPVKIHSQGGWADSSIARFNIIVTENTGYPIVYENCSSVYIYNNTLVSKYWGFSFWDRDRFRLEAYYGTTKNCKVYNNIIKGSIYIGGEWTNQMITAVDKYKWDTVYTFTNYTSTTSDIDYIEVTDFGRFTGYVGLGLASGDSLHKYNEFLYNTYDLDYYVRYAETGDFPNQSGATNNDYALDNNTYWLRSRSGETARNSIDFTDDNSEDLTVPTTLLNYGDYSLTVGSPDLGSGMTIINPGWTTYKPLTDYSGNTINYTTPNRGAIQ